MHSERERARESESERERARESESKSKSERERERGRARESERARARERERERESTHSLAIEAGRYRQILRQKNNSHHCDLNTEVTQIHFLCKTSARDEIPSN